MSGRDFDIDYSERAGFLTGKSAAIAEWRHRKEVSDFERLCSKLYQRKWARLERQRNGTRVRERLNVWRAANRDKVRAQERARRAAKRKPRLFTCVECGRRRETKRVAKFCSTKCRNRFHCRPRVVAKNRGIRNMSLRPALLALLVQPMTLRELVAALPLAKRNSIATLLSTLTRSGVLHATPQGRGRSYSLASKGCDQ